jgi:hypothetical protein
MARALDEALEGLLAYWRVRPSGGTRAELLTLAAAQGFTEPALGQWLDALIAGFVRLGIIASATYAALATMRQTVGFDLAAERARLVYAHLLAGRELEPIRKTNEAQLLDTLIAGLTSKIANVDQGIAFVLANFAPGTVRDDTLEAANLGRAALNKRLTFWAEKRDLLRAEAAA